LSKRPLSFDFPADFVWGAATSSYQIEGATDEDGRSPSIWDTFAAQPGKISDGTSGAGACDHYHRYPEDIALIKSLGVEAYRFSIAWPRILPQGTGPVNEAGLDFYERLVDTMLENGLEPYATLYHWDMPQAQFDKADWTKRAVVDAFAEYADVVTRVLGDRVKRWMTINEPWCVSFLGYGSGEHAPGYKDYKQYLQASHNVLLAHGRAVPIIRENVGRDAKVGIVLNQEWAAPATDAPEDIAAARRYDGFFNRWFLEPLYNGQYPDDMWEIFGELVPKIDDGDLKEISVPTDFLGVNYYSRSTIGHGDESPLQLRWEKPDVEYTDMGWQVYPDGLYNTLSRIHRDYAPGDMYVTENGAAYKDVVAEDGIVYDEGRTAYIQEHVAAVGRAVADGVPVRGYFVWSLMDNFEWAQGYSKRFGITHVDYETQKRTLKQSGRWFSEVTRRTPVISG